MNMVFSICSFQINRMFLYQFVFEYISLPSKSLSLLTIFYLSNTKYLFLISKFMEVKYCLCWSKKLISLQKNIAEASGKRKTRQSHTIQFKKDVVPYAVNLNNQAAAPKFNI